MSVSSYVYFYVLAWRNYRDDEMITMASAPGFNQNTAIKIMNRTSSGTAH